MKMKRIYCLYVLVLTMARAWGDGNKTKMIGVIMLIWVKNLQFSSVRLSYDFMNYGLIVIASLLILYRT